MGYINENDKKVATLVFEIILKKIQEKNGYYNLTKFFILSAFKKIVSKMDANKIFYEDIKNKDYIKDNPDNITKDNIEKYLLEEKQMDSTIKKVMYSIKNYNTNDRVSGSLNTFEDNSFDLKTDDFSIKNLSKHSFLISMFPDNFKKEYVEIYSRILGSDKSTISNEKEEKFKLVFKQLKEKYGKTDKYNKDHFAQYKGEILEFCKKSI